VKKRFFYFLITAFCISAFLSCRERGFKNMDEGQIFYNIKYVKNTSTMPEELLPKELVITFKDDKIISELKGPFGGSGLSTLTNPDENVYDTYFNLISLKYCFEGTSEKVQPGFSSMKGILFIETGEEREILGFNCTKLGVKVPSSDSLRFIWYTDEIKVSQPNRLTPYRAIDGVLLNFFYIMGDTEINFAADEVFVREIPDKTFEKKKNYKKVSSGFLDSLIVKMIAY